MTKTFKRLALISSLVLIPALSQAAIISFTPSGTSTVPQGSNLYWDMLSGATSTSSLGTSEDFYLSDHGDFHWNLPADMVTVAGTSGGDTLPAGTLIGSGSNWDSTDGDNQYAGTTDYSGQMVSGDTAYFGLSFQIGGQTHYGWVQVSEGPVNQSVLRWAYESTPNTPIQAGALGAAAAVPTISEWGMILLSGLLALMAVFTLRRQRQ